MLALMRLLLIVLVLATLVVFPANAQKFKPGYYITVSGDTIKDDILLKKKKQQIISVDTKDGLSLKPEDLRGMGQEGVNYIVRSVTMDKSPQLGSVIDTVFLEIISRGNMSFFYTIDENDKAHFYIENESGLWEVSVRLVAIENSVNPRRLETYIETLKILFPTCTDLFPAIEKTIFSKKGITSIYEKLYKCRYNEAPLANGAGKGETLTDFGVLAGMSMTNIHFFNKLSDVDTGPATNLVSNFNFKTSIDPTLGVFLDTKFGRTKSFALRQELTFRRYNCKSDYQVNQGPNHLLANVMINYLKYSLAGRLFFNKNTFRPFATLGVSPAYAVSMNQTLERTTGGNAGKEPLYKKVAEFEMGAFVGVGAMYSNFSFDARYEYSSGLLARSNSKVNTLYLILSYTLKKVKTKKPR
jgi:hypothetical protein